MSTEEEVRVGKRSDVLAQPVIVGTAYITLELFQCVGLKLLGILASVYRPFAVSSREHSKHNLAVWDHDLCT